MLQNATSLRKSAPGPPNISDKHVSCIAPATENASLQILFTCPTPAIVFGNATKTLTFCSLLTRCTIPCACHAKAHLNVQKWSEPLVLLTFWLRNVLRATMACTFSTSQLLKVVRSWCVLCTFWLRNVLRATTACNFSFLIWPAGSAPAALASLLFDPPEPQIIGKTQCFATFLPFRASASSFFWGFLLLFLFSSLLFSSLLFSSLLFFDSYHLCFSSVHIVGSLTSKLPSAKNNSSIHDGNHSKSTR